MSNATVLMTIRLLDTEYRVACPEREQEALITAADYLNSKMTDIHNQGKLVGIERIAVMAALNITHDLLVCQQERDALSQLTKERLHNLSQRIETALSQLLE